jgi:hypothetical protein
MLRAGASFMGAQCAAAALGASSLPDPTPDPSPGDGAYILIRGRNACGAGPYGEETAEPGPRAALDAASPCP